MININSIYSTTRSGNIRVLKKDQKTDFYTIEFINTGFRKSVRGDQIKSGSVRDPYAKIVCGVACVGNIKTKGKYKTLYSIWHDMINRCYNKKNKRYNTYKNVSVDESWLIFENFYNDAPLIEGYDKEKINEGKLVLDKDTKQRFSENKCYSLKTCIWIAPTQNNQIQDSQQKYFIAISPEGEKIRDYNITRFAKEHGLERKHISGVLHNRAKSTGGWKFIYEEIV